MERENNKRVKILFLLSITFLLVLSVLSYIRFSKLIDSSKWVNHTSMVKLHLGNTYSVLLEMETNQRAYIITKDTAFLKPYYSKTRVLNMLLGQLDSLTMDNPSQHGNSIVLRSLIDKRRTYLQQLLEQSAGNAITSQEMSGGRILMDQVRGQISRMTNEEEILFNQRIQQLNKEALLTPIVTFVLILFSILILIAAYYKITGDLKISDTLRQELEKTNVELKKNEELFSKMFENSPVALTFGEISNNKIIYANKLFYSYFGFSDGEVIGRSADELNLVSPEENARLLPIILSYLDENRSVEELQKLPPEETAALLIKLRERMFGNGFEVLYTRKNKETFSALVFYEVIEIGKIQYALTSYQDISDRKRTEMKVEKQNEELTKMNRELESFNYISSHDLQEPLRKIQMFSSQIIEKESVNVSAKGKTILKRMQDSAFKMQTLIQDLLLYSRTNVADRKFEKTDINKMIEEVKDDLKEEFKQKKATLEVKGTCELNVIPFQFRQLLYNLISNSIKFAKAGEPLLIKIENHIIQRPAAGNLNLKKDGSYCHLSISDNGIGFESEYNSKVFEIFQRLQPESEYKGTGIGLAIVKKIVENHEGHITASGSPNQGARFDIYIPVRASTPV